MLTNQFDNLRLNIGDTVRLIIPEFHYTLGEQDGNKTVEENYFPVHTDDWIHCRQVIGVYVGETCDAEGNIEVVKVRVTRPFKMRDGSYSHLKIPLSKIESILATKKVKESVLDKLSHTIPTVK
jgi:uncharacterized protein YrzB (UPF0473 family)